MRRQGNEPGLRARQFHLKRAFVECSYANLVA